MRFRFWSYAGCCLWQFLIKCSNIIRLSLGRVMNWLMGISFKASKIFFSCNWFFTISSCWWKVLKIYNSDWKCKNLQSKRNNIMERQSKQTTSKTFLYSSLLLGWSKVSFLSICQTSTNNAKLLFLSSFRRSFINIKAKISWQFPMSWRRRRSPMLLYVIIVIWDQYISNFNHITRRRAYIPYHCNFNPQKTV